MIVTNDMGHRWGDTHDRERVECMKCGCSPLSWQAKEPCSFDI